MGITVDGRRALQQLGSLRRNASGLVGKALYAEALIESQEAQRVTPLLTGATRASYVVTEPAFEPVRHEIVVFIQVGGPTLGYVVPLHENLEAHHNEGKAKFLESTLRASAPFIMERVAKRLDLSGALR